MNTLATYYLSHLLPCCTLPHAHALAYSAVYSVSHYLGDVTPPHRPCRQEVRKTSPLRQFIRLRVESYSSARGLPTGRVGKSVGYAAQRWRGDLLSTYISHLIPCCTLPHVHAWALSAVYAESLYLGDLIPPHRPCRQEVRNTSPLTACLNGPCTWWHSTKDG